MIVSSTNEKKNHDIKGYDMTAKEYDKAFKFLTQRYRDLTHDRKSRLAITFSGHILPKPLIVQWYNGIYRYFVDNHCNIIYGNTIADSRIINLSHNYTFYSVGHLTKSFTKKDFIKMWIDNAIGNDLYIYILNRKSADVKIAKLLDSNDTVESLCIQYDMTHI